MKYFGLLVICTIALTGCSKPSTNNNNSSSLDTSSNESALSELHARPDPTLLAQVRSQEQQQRVALASTNGNTGGTMLANLPAVSQASLAPPANQVVHADLQQSSVTPVTGNNNPWPFNNPSADNHNDNNQIASYAPYNHGPSHTTTAASGSLVPPPPAVVLSTQAQPVSFAAPIDVYGNPYNGGNYDAPAPPVRSSGSLFGMNSARMNNNDNNNSNANTDRRHIDFVPITPTGMDARSAYKQRDDLKLLWKGAISSSSLQSLSQKDSQEINAIVVGLPSEPSRGNINISQRQSDYIFKSPALDKRIVAAVKKLELDVAQSYYRYLYAFNKYALAQQTVAARKQEMDYANDPAERQRAAADWSAAKTDADEATDDMKSAQSELASAAGAQATRVIIGRVSGVTPSADSLAQAADSQASVPAADKRSLFSSLFHFGSEQPATSSNEGVKATAAKLNKNDTNKTAKNDKGNKTDKGKVTKHDKNTPAIHGPLVAKDLTPAPDAASSASTEHSASSKASAEDSATIISHSGSGGVAFVMKGVSVTPRKSIIKVAIRNNGDDNFTFDPDTVGVREGMSKLPDAMVRADFDTTKVAPNEEVSGTITIFGRPWNDRLSIYLADGSRSIQMRR